MNDPPKRYSKGYSAKRSKLTRTIPMSLLGKEKNVLRHVPTKEVSMKTRRLSGYLNVKTFLSSLFILLSVVACAEVHVTCTSAGSGASGEPPVGCNSVTYGGSAEGYKRTDNGQPAAAGSMCSGAGSKRCNPSTPPGAGKCGFGGPTCINWWNPTNNVCKCDCP